jgi:hypothetical protein
VPTVQTAPIHSEAPLLLASVDNSHPDFSQRKVKVVLPMLVSLCSLLCARLGVLLPVVRHWFNTKSFVPEVLLFAAERSKLELGSPADWVVGE